MELWGLNLRHMRAVAEICHLGSLSAASEAVHLTQPALTQALARLEKAIGLALFDRTPGGMTARPSATLLADRINAALGYLESPRITMTQMRALIAFAASGSYVGASVATGLSQPSLHRAIRDLSLALKRTLVERRGKGLALTKAGRRTLRTFRLARAELEAGLSEIAAIKGIETRRIAIGAMPLARARLLPKAIASFNRLHPDVRIVVAEGSYSELIEPLRDGELDLLIGALRTGGDGEDLAQRPLFDDRPVVIARKGHPLAQPDIAAMASFPWIIAAPGTPLRSQWEGMFLDAGIAPPPVPIECGSVIVIRQILIETDFLTLLSPDQVALELKAGWLSKICEAPPSLRRTIGITTRSGWRPTAMQQAFLDILRAVSEG
jgi:LysR family transcriptional regulator, regulator for genes of the gallate degradation pathway